MAATTYREVLASLGPTHHWRFDEPSGTPAADSVGAANGTYTNGPALNQAGLIPTGAAAKFTRASSQYVTVPDNADWKNLTSLSIVMIVSFGIVPVGAATFYHLMSHNTSTVDSAGEWKCGMNDQAGTGSNIRLWTQIFDGTSGVAAFQQASWNPVAGTRYLLGYVWTGTAWRFYLDGVQFGVDVARAGTIGGTDTSPLNIGCSNGATPGEFFDGTIDEPAFWKNRVLTAQEMANLAAALDNVPVPDVAMAPMTH